MKTYTDSFWLRFYDFVCYFVVAGFAFIIITALKLTLWAYALPAVIVVYALYRLVGQRRMFVLLDDRELRIGRGSRETHCFQLKDTAFSFYSKTTHGTMMIATDHDYRLYAQVGEREPVLIDLSDLSYKDFHQLLYDLGIYDPERSVRVETTPRR